MSNDVAAFIDKWSKSEAAEQKNKDLFLTELCDVLGIGQGFIVLLMDDEDRKAEIELRERLSVLARRLPSLVDAPGLGPPIDVLALARWAADPLT